MKVERCLFEGHLTDRLTIWLTLWVTLLVDLKLTLDVTCDCLSRMINSLHFVQFFRTIADYLDGECISALKKITSTVSFVRVSFKMEFHSLQKYKEDLIILSLCSFALTNTI